MKIFKIIVLCVTACFLCCDSFSDGEKCNGLSLDRNSIIIGDSQLAFLRKSCENMQIHLGNLIGINYADFSANGAYILDGYHNGTGLLGEIPAQYEKAKEIGGVPEVVIFNGGMNDVHNDFMKLTSKCKDGLTSNCENVIKAVQGGIESLIKKMKHDGVEKIVYIGIFYRHDYDTEVYDFFLNPLKEEICPAEGALFVELRDAFAGHDDYVLDDGHANNSGSRVMAELVFDALNQ